MNVEIVFLTKEHNQSHPKGFAEEALVTGCTRNARVTAKGACQVLQLDRETFLELVFKPLVSDVTLDETPTLILGDKEKLVKNQYAQLVAIAHKITRQKAEIKKASQDLQSTLEATAQLQREIDAVRTTITDGIGNFDSLESELSGTR